MKPPTGMRVLTSAATLLLAFSAHFLHGQEIRIKLMDARDGKPIRNECLNVWTGTERDRHLVTETNNDGIAVLRFGRGDIIGETACKGWESQAPMNAESDALMLAPDWHVACQEYKRPLPGEPLANPLMAMPAYPVKKILESGISASNTCGRFRQQAKPGELILFVRSRTLLEKMRQ